MELRGHSSGQYFVCDANVFPWSRWNGITRCYMFPLAPRSDWPSPIAGAGTTHTCLSLKLKPEKLFCKIGIHSAVQDESALFQDKTTSKIPLRTLIKLPFSQCWARYIVWDMLYNNIICFNGDFNNEQQPLLLKLPSLLLLSCFRHGKIQHIKMETLTAAVTTTPLMSAKSAARYNAGWWFYSHTCFSVQNVECCWCGGEQSAMSSLGVLPWGDNQSQGTRCPGHDRWGWDWLESDCNKRGGPWSQGLEQ